MLFRSFQQVYPVMGESIRRRAVSALGDCAGVRVWDLYAGVGETAALLAARGAVVDAVESDPPAAREAARGLARWDETVAVHPGRAEILTRELPPPDLVIANPPRTGMATDVVQAIRRAGPRRVVYVSCDPATLARDLSRMLAERPDGPGYRLQDVIAFDLFPQTAHVEIVAVLDRV